MINENNVISEIVEKISDNCRKNEILLSKKSYVLPSRDIIIDILNDIRKVMFPGYFNDELINDDSIEYFVGNTLSNAFEKLKKQLNYALSYMNDNKDSNETGAKSECICAQFFSKLPQVQKMLLKDVEAFLNGDPAAKSREEIIFSYPGLYAIYVYRVAHILYEKNIPFIPRIMTEYAHSQTGIDINSGAKIGEYFFIDHGTGVVIGETTEIGNNVKIYQGVTLGALSTRSGQALSGIKRHPTIKDNVTIYSGSSILGGETVIGEDSVIGGNSFITKSIPPHTKVSIKAPELIIKKPSDEKFEI